MVSPPVHQANFRTPNRPAVTGIFTLLVLIVLFFACRFYNLRHLSSGVKLSLAAAMNPSNTDADIATYLHEARIEVVTRRDAEEVRLLERLIDISQFQADHYHAFLLMMSGDDEAGKAERSFKFVTHLEAQYREQGTPIPDNLRRERKQSLEDWKHAIAQRREQQKADQRRLVEEECEANRIIEQLQADLKLLPSGASKHRN